MTTPPETNPSQMSAAEAILYAAVGLLEASDVSAETGVGRFVIAALPRGVSGRPSTGSVKIVSPHYVKATVAPDIMPRVTELLEIEDAFAASELTIPDFVDEIIEVFLPEIQTGAVSGPSLALINIFISRALLIHNSPIRGVVNLGSIH